MAKESTREELICLNAERLVRFDTIRVCKLFEIIQYALLTIPLAWMCGGWVLIFLKDYAEKPDDYTVGQLIFAIFITIIIMGLFAYYIPKIVKIIPPLFPYHGTGYVPSKKGESGIGASIALGVFFFSNMKHLGTVIGNVSDRLWPFSYKLKSA